MKTKINRKKQITILIVCFINCFLLSDKSLASISDSNFQIPNQLGTIKESFSAQGTINNGGRTIIHIQDAHCNYEAQKKMAQILDYLIKKENLRLILVEGGSGDVSLSSLRAYTDKKTREEVAEKYLKEGKISGEEYLDIVSDYNLELYGIEDEALYEAHLDAFLKIDSIREKGVSDLKALSSIIEALKPKIYNRALRQLEEEIKGYKDKKISLGQYCQYLKETAAGNSLNFKEWPQLDYFTETARLEKEIDFKQAESERNALIKDLANTVDQNTANELINKSQDFKSKKIDSQLYYSFLRDLAIRQKLNLEQNYVHLNAYINYTTISKEINTKDLLREVDSLTKRIKEALFTNTDEKRLSEISDAFDVLSGLLTLELTPEDYAIFKAGQSKFYTAAWINFLTESCQKYNLAIQAQASRVIDDNLGMLNEFYQLGAQREKAFIKNIADKMDESGEKIAVLITGGFHTPGITSLLKEKDYSYFVVMPVITEKSDSNVYFSVLRSARQPLEYIEEEESEE